MKTVAFTPIRLNSTRLHRKSVKPLNGIPMLNYQISTVNQLVRDDIVDENYIFCSRPVEVGRYLRESVKYIQRHPGLDANNVLGMEIYKAFVESVPADLYVLYHVTSPLLSRNAYEEGLWAITEDGHDSAFTVLRHQTFAWTHDDPINYFTTHIPQTQNIQPVFTETSGFYMFTREVFSTGRRIGNNPFKVEVGIPEGIDIDTQEDFDVAEALLRGGWGR